MTGQRVMIVAAPPTAKALADAALRISKARAALVLKSPFFASLALRLTPRPVSNGHTQTMSTDGRSIYYEPGWVNQKTHDELVGVVAHEAMHCGFLHPFRRQHRDHGKFNRACLAWGTRVRLCDGTDVPIQMVQPGEYVMSPLGENRVLAVAFTGWRETIKLEFGEASVICTPDHRFGTEGGFIDAAKISDAPANGYVLEDSWSARVRRGELQEAIASRIKSGNRSGVCFGGSIPLQTRIDSEQVFAEAAQFAHLECVAGTGVCISCGAGRWRGNGVGIPLSAWVLAPHFEHCQHVAFFNALAERQGLSCSAGSERDWKFILSAGGFRFSDRHTVAEDAALSRRQEAARTSVAASHGDPEAASIQRAHSGKFRVRGDAGVDQTVQQARGAIRARARQLLPVFDLITEAGSYFAEGILTHNCDHAINLVLKAAGFHLPKDGLMDPQYADMTAEAIYTRLPDEPPSPNGCYGGMGSVEDAPNEDGTGPASEAEMQQLAAEWQVTVLQAAQAAKAQGHLPAGLEALAESIRAPKVDWRAALREFVRAHAKGDYSWRRPNPRHLATGDYLPSLYDETVGPLVLGVDTSGSVSQAELDAVCAELNGVLDAARPESVAIVYCDTHAYEGEIYGPEDWPVSMKVKGRGGTHLAPVWAFVRDKELRPVCAILTTDMELCVGDLGDDPGFPCLILSTGRAAPMDGPLPFGTLVELSVEP